MMLYITTAIALFVAFSLFGVAWIFTKASEQKRLEEQRMSGQ